MGFEMIGMIRGLGTLVVFIAFIGLSLWVFNGGAIRNSPKRACCPSPTTPAPDAQEEPATRSNRP
jgi:cytochrome c oxidase cbb3-type subunit 4